MSAQIFIDNNESIYPISPSNAGIARVVYVDGHSISRRQESVVLRCIVIPVDGQGNAIEDLATKAYARDIFASNERKVNPTNGYTCTPTTDEEGNITGWIDLAGVSVANPIGQYDFFKAMLTQPVLISQVEANVVAMCDMEGSFNVLPN